MLANLPCKKSLSSFLVGPLQVLKGCYKVSPDPSLLQAEQPQIDTYLLNGLHKSLYFCLPLSLNKPEGIIWPLFLGAYGLTKRLRYFQFKLLFLSSLSSLPHKKVSALHAFYSSGSQAAFTTVGALESIEAK